VFYCLDKALHTALQPFVTERIELVLYDDEVVTTEFTHYGNSQEFLKMMKRKLLILHDALAKYEFIHFVDGDVVFCIEPTEDYYETYKDYDIVYQRDAPPPNQPFHEWTCTGNFVLRKNERTVRFLNLIQSYQEKRPMNEQECQREIFRDSNVSDIRNYLHAKLTEFPMEEFSCGACVRDGLVKQETIMVFHANHVTGNDAKQGLLKRIGKWYL